MTHDFIEGKKTDVVREYLIYQHSIAVPAGIPVL